MNKRFIIDKDGITIIDDCTDGVVECKHHNEAVLLCDFLNKQDKKIQQYEYEIDSFKEIVVDLVKDNVDLLDEINSLKEAVTDLVTENANLR